MVLGRLLVGAVRPGVVLVTTSNYRARRPVAERPASRPLPARHSPAHQDWLDVVEVDAGVDYRLRTLEQVKGVPRAGGPMARCRRLERAFDAMRSGPDEDPKLAIERRTSTARRRAGARRMVRLSGAVRRAALASATTLETRAPLRRRCSFRTSRVMVRGRPRTGRGASRGSMDILYDHRVQLLASAAAPAEALYTRRTTTPSSSSRTVSRLAEMRTREYMALPHNADAAAAAPI